MRIRDLGPLVVEVAGSSTALGPTKQAVLLSVLAARAGRVVPARDLIAAAWGVDVEVPLSSLDSQLWRLRNVLEPTRRRSSSVLVRDGNGYRLAADPDDVDSLRFERLADQAAAALAAGRAEDVVALVDEALGLWRGDQFGAAVGDPGLSAWAARAGELRDQLCEQRIEALMSLGRLERALADLEPMLARTPLRERLWWQRMSALYGLDRVDEALASYRRAAALLSDELGLDPGPELQRLHTQILTRDPAARADGRSVRPIPAVVGADPPRRARSGLPSVRLPRRRTQLIGRSADLDRLTALVSTQRLVTICGTGGSGKTRLAVEVAARAAARFPDGVWFVDLTAVSAPHLVLDVVVTTLALGASRVVDPLDALAAFARGSRLLVVLDNCEHVLDGVAEVVEALLDEDAESAAGPVVLATSREPIGIDGEQLWPIASLSLLSRGRPAGDGAESARSPAAQLFVQRARAADPHLQLEDSSAAIVTEICRALDGLPLAIELAAARVRSFSLAEIAEQVRADPSRLSRLGRHEQDHRQSLYDAIEWSYRLLPEPEQVLHRYLSMLPGPFTSATICSIASDVGLDEFEITDALLGLAHRSLLDVRPGTRTCYAQLDTVRAHAERHLVAAGEASRVLARRDAWVASLLARRPRLGQLDAPAWYDELEVSYPIVRAALQQAVTADGNQELVRLGSGLGFFWFFRSRMIEGARWLEAAQAGGRLPAGGVDEVATRLRLAGAFLLRFRPDLARPHLEVALGRLDDLPPESVVVISEALVSAAGGAWGGAAYDVLPVVRDALARLAAGTDDQVVRLFAEVVGCIALLPLGRFDEAGEQAERLYARSLELGNLVVAWLSSLAGTVVATESLQVADALGWARRVLDLHERLGSGGSKAFLDTVGNCLALTGDYGRAAQVYSAARTLAKMAGVSWPEHPRSRELFARTRAGLEPAEFDQAWAAGERLSMRDLAAWATEGAEHPG